MIARALLALILNSFFFSLEKCSGEDIKATSYSFVNFFGHELQYIGRDHRNDTGVKIGMSEVMLEISPVIMRKFMGTPLVCQSKIVS